MKYIDAHSHWTDSRLSQDNQAIENRRKVCADKNIDFFLQGGVNPDEWLRQISIKNKYPQNFGLCFGLHPYYVSEHSSDECEAALDQLAQLLPQAMALGETGLDFRPHIMKDAEGLQIEIFENQMALAKAFKKPLVLHIVKAHAKALQIFDIWGAPPQSGFVHAYNGSYETAKKYIDLGFLISVGGAVTYDKNKKLLDCIMKLNLEYLLIESDAPDQAPKDWEGLNDSSAIYQIADKIALLKNLSVFEVLDISRNNFKRLFGV